MDSDQINNIPEENMCQIGKVAVFFGNVGVAAIRLSGNLKLGDQVLFKGATTNFEQIIDSMQINRNPVEEVNSGDDVGVKVIDKVRAGDIVYKRLNWLYAKEQNMFVRKRVDVCL